MKDWVRSEEWEESRGHSLRAVNCKALGAHTAGLSGFRSLLWAGQNVLITEE